MAFTVCIPQMSIGQQGPRVVQAANLTKLGVSLAAAGGLIAFHDSTSLLVVGGAIANAGATKVLKKTINKPRPKSEQSATKATSGMPSSHASSLSFFASTLVLLNPGELVYIAFFAAAMVAASWRVGAGYHTRAQVVAGVAWGGAVAFFWVFCAMPALEATVTGALQGRFGPWPLTCAIGFVGVLAVFRGEALKFVKQRRRQDLQ